MAPPGQPQSAHPPENLYNPQWETVTSHGIARAATKCPPPPETLYNPRWETVT